MGLRFQITEDVDDGVRRMARERLAKIVRSIESATDTAVLSAPGSKPAPPLTKVVHRVRTNCKELRGLLRLVKPALGGEFERANAALRAAGASVGDARDHDTLIACHDDLVMSVGAGAQRVAPDPIREALVGARTSPSHTEVVAGLLAAAQYVRSVAARVEEWRLTGRDFDVLARGFERSYQRARQAMKEALRNDGAEERHEWRKRAKVHWYHLRILAPTWPVVIGAMCDEGKRLTEALGTERDLDRLAAAIAALEGEVAAPNAAYRDELATRREKARRTAVRSARRLFCRRPSAAVADHRALWRAWRTKG